MELIKGERENTFLINNHLVLRDGELFHRKFGLGFCSPDLAEKYKGVVPIGREERIVWLPAETGQLALEMSHRKSILVVGSSGSGKSALIYGLRSLFRDRDQSYLFLDGHHFKDAPTEKIEASLSWAKKNNADFIIDSMDYLIAGRGRRKKMSREKLHKKAGETLGSIIDFIDEGGTVVGTAHNENWMARYADLELHGGIWEKLQSKMAKHSVVGRFDNSSELLNFYRHAFPGWNIEISYLARLPNNSEFIDFLKGTYANQDVDEILDSLQGYRIAKLFAFHSEGQNVEILDKTRFYLSTNDPQTRDEIWGKMAAFVIAKNEETRKMDGGPDLL